MQIIFSRYNASELVHAVVQTVARSLITAVKDRYELLKGQMIILISGTVDTMNDCTM